MVFSWMRRVRRPLIIWRAWNSNATEKASSPNIATIPVVRKPADLVKILAAKVVAPATKRGLYAADVFCLFCGRGCTLIPSYSNG